jgi:ubiquitin-protein ligase
MVESATESQSVPIDLEAPPELQKWASANDPKPEETSKYEQLLGGYRFNTCSMSQDGSYNHSMSDSVGSLEELQAKARRFNNEMKAFTHGLPCHASSAIYVVMEETRMDLMKALISGPEDSPYAHGLYLFDIACPENYPDSPPSVSIMTTGNGTVRFNPNLYDSGYVCLSIINTWDSMPEEMWNPQHSNLLQVFVSIQALVMDELIIQKEPSYEGYEKDSPANVAYSSIVRYNNIKWAMLDVIRRPPAEFKTVVFRHFSLKKTEVLRTLETWLREAEAQEVIDYYCCDSLVSEHNHHTCELFTNSGGYLANLKTVVAELTEELSLLPELGDLDDLDQVMADYETSVAGRRQEYERQREVQPAVHPDEPEEPLELPKPQEVMDLGEEVKQVEALLVHLEAPEVPEVAVVVEAAAEMQALVMQLEKLTQEDVGETELSN